MKNNNVTIYQFEQNDVRMVQKGGEPWFVLSDLCKVLELSTPSRVSERLDRDEKGVSLIHTLGGAQKVTVVNESGMYAVILRSDKPQAKPFRKWITSEVLPSIRKTGKIRNEAFRRFESQTGRDSASKCKREKGKPFIENRRQYENAIQRSFTSTRYKAPDGRISLALTRSQRAYIFGGRDSGKTWNDRL